MQKINVVEVGPRDGYQSIDSSCGIIPTEIKLKYIRGILNSGIKSVQLTSFVSPKAIPQLQDAKIVAETIISEYKNMDLFALIPNLRGAQNAYEAGLRKAAYVVSFSKSHNKANINRTHEQSLDAYKEIKDTYPDLNVEVNFATTFGCPFEGKYKQPDEFIKFLSPYVDEGIETAVLADTIGIADPKQVEIFIKAIKEAYPNIDLAIHFHDTRGLGIANTLTAIKSGVNRVESTLGGLGGCPFAPGASGNLATEDLVWMLNEAGYQTGINFDKLVELSKEQTKEIDGKYSGHQINIINN